MAAGLWGSLGLGDADDWSDVDLVAVVPDSDVTTVIDDLKASESPFGSAGVVIDLPQNGVGGGGFLSITYIEDRPPVHVDWYLCPSSMGGLAPDLRELFGHSALPGLEATFADLLDKCRSTTVGTPQPWFVLSMVPIAVKFVVRASPRTPDVLARVGVDPSLAWDQLAALAALEPVLAHNTDPAGDPAVRALQALLELTRTSIR